MSIHQRHCALPDCRRHAMRRKATCRVHLGHPDGRVLNQQTRRLARMLSELTSIDDLDPAPAHSSKYRVRTQIERGDFNDLLAPTLSELMEHARFNKDLSWLIGANKVAITRLLV